MRAQHPGVMGFVQVVIIALQIWWLALYGYPWGIGIFSRAPQDADAIHDHSPLSDSLTVLPVSKASILEIYRPSFSLLSSSPEALGEILPLSNFYQEFHLCS